MIFSVFHPSFILCCAFDRFPRPLTLFILFQPFSDPFPTLFRPFSNPFPTLFCLQRHASGVHRTNTHFRATLPPASLARKATQRTRAAATPGPRAHPVLLDARSRKGPAMIVKRVFGLPRQIHPWSAWPVTKAHTGISSPAFKHPIVSIVSRANTTMYWALPMLPRAKIVLRGTWVVVVVVLFVVVCCCLLFLIYSFYVLSVTLSVFFRCVFWFLCRLAGNTVRKIVWLPKETTIFVLVCPVVVVNTAPNPVSTTPQIAPIAPLANI